jgi:D-alanyl-D-alanine carboxypeptidase/D-alanyl-D-alanine-endopeptidase (penicillin-binding protein 4)
MLPSLALVLGPAVAATAAWAAAAGGPPPPPGGLAASIAAILARPELRGTHWGILVANTSGISSAGAPSVVFERNADSFFVPASNKKLLATSAGKSTHTHTPARAGNRRES